MANLSARSPSRSSNSSNNNNNNKADMITQRHPRLALTIVRMETMVALWLRVGLVLTPITTALENAPSKIHTHPSYHLRCLVHPMAARIAHSGVRLPRRISVSLP
jgi:hypothetical protein